MNDEPADTDDSIARRPIDRDLYEPAPSAGWRVVYPIMEVAL